MNRAVRSLDGKTPVNHKAFAKLLAPHLQRFYAVERADKENVVIQYFDH